MARERPVKAAFDRIYCMCQVRESSFVLSWWDGLHWFPRGIVLYWIRFKVLIVKNLSDYFVVFLASNQWLSLRWILSRQSCFIVTVVIIIIYNYWGLTYRLFSTFRKPERGANTHHDCVSPLHCGSFHASRTSHLYLASSPWHALTSRQCIPVDIEIHTVAVRPSPVTLAIHMHRCAH